MPEKLGNGGHSYEKYDPETGKYVEDGKPNKYYDNPKEKTLSNQSKIDLLKEKFPDFFAQDREQDEELNARFTNNKNQEKYTKPILEMSREELLAEIGEHTNFLISKGIDLTEFKNAFIDKLNRNDFRLKCANFREMHRLIEKYPINLKGCEFICSNHFSVNSGNLASAGYRVNYFVGFIPNRYIKFNAKKFQNYEQTKDDELKDVKTNFHPDCSDELLVSASFIHEFGHCITYDYIAKNNLFSGEDAAYIYDNYSSKMVTRKIREKLYSICGLIKDEVYKIYMSQNPGLSQTEAYENFNKDTSKYGNETESEWFAETFASLECGKPTKSALALKEWLDKNNISKKEV